MDQMFLILEPSGQTEADQAMALGVRAHRAGNMVEAGYHYRQCLRLNPSHGLCLNNVALLHVHQQDMNEALLTIERAAILAPRVAMIHANWAFICLASHWPDAAVRHAQRAAGLDRSGLTCRAFASILLAAGEVGRAMEAYDAALAEEPDNQVAAISACFAQSLTDDGPSALLARRQLVYERFCADLPKCEPRPMGERKRLRVGYVSGDFRTHSASAIFRAVILRHSSAVEAFCYSTAPAPEKPDVITEHFKRTLGPRWRHIATLHDAEACALIQQDEIDILVDLSAHSTGGRLGIFARKPAPVQVTAWGFALGTGLPEMDYFFADPVAVPESERVHFAEKIWDLPCLMTLDKSYLDDLGDNPTIPYHANGYITFGCFGRSQKVSGDYLSAVFRILRANMDARILFRDFSYHSPDAMRRMLHALAGIDPGRIAFASGPDSAEHIQAYQQCDVMLDPFPHTGGVSSMEQIYMGVPILTRYGKNVAGRLTASLLTAIGREEWIAADIPGYVAKAVALSLDIPAIDAARKNLRKEFARSPAMKDYVSEVEKAYAGMWEKYVAFDKNAKGE